MSDIPSSFLSQSLKFCRGYARRTQKQNLYANTTFLPNGQLQLELPANALIDLDTLCINATLVMAGKNADRYQAFPPTVGAFIQNATVTINGEPVQVTDYVGDLQVVISDFSYGNAVKKRMGLQQLGNISKYTTGADTTYDIILTAADIPGFLSSVQPRVLNTAFFGPLQINLMLKGPEILGQGLGAGNRFIVSTGGAGVAPTAANTLNTVDDERDLNGFRDLPGGTAAALATESSGAYRWDDVFATMDVLAMPAEFTQLNQMVLASGRSFTYPYHHWSVFPSAMQQQYGKTTRFSVASRCLDMAVSWFNPRQDVQNRYCDQVTRRSTQWNRVMPATWQMLVGGTLVPSFVCDRRLSWQIFLTSLGKLHDAAHEFHPALQSMRTWNEKLGVMLYRFNVLDAGGQEIYSGLNTNNASIQCTITTTPMAAGEGSDGTLIAGTGTQYIAVKTTRILQIAANKSTMVLS
jgi:hypothetical protein